MAKPKITLYLDIVSPFAYVAYYLTRHHPTFHSSKVSITYVPILLGGLMKKCDNRAPLEIRNKDKWIEVERKRWAEQFNIPIAPGPPAGFPIMTIAAMRAMSYLNEKHTQEDVVKGFDALYQNFWGEANGAVAKADGEKGFGAVLKRVLAEDVFQDVMGNCTSKVAKDSLIVNTDKAFDNLAFGLPWFQCQRVDGDMQSFWGVDHMGQVIKFLGLEKQGEFKALL